MAGPNRQLSAREISSINGPIRVTGEGFGLMRFNNGAELLRWLESHPGTHLWSPLGGTSPVTDSREATNESTGEVNLNTLEEGNRSFGEWLSDFWNKNYAWQYLDFKQNDPIFGLRRLDNFNRVDRLNPNFMNNWDILNNNLEMINIGGLGIPNKLALSQLYGFGRDLYNGKNVLDSWYGLNTGFFTEELMAKHPILASGINLAFDIGVPWATSKIRNVTRFANALRFNNPINKNPLNSKVSPSTNNSVLNLTNNLHTKLQTPLFMWNGYELTFPPRNLNNLNNTLKYQLLWNLPSRDEIIRMYTRNWADIDRYTIADLYYGEEIYPRLFGDYPPVPEGIFYDVPNDKVLWNFRNFRLLDRDAILKNPPAHLYSLIPTLEGTLVSVSEPIRMVESWPNSGPRKYIDIKNRVADFGGWNQPLVNGEAFPYINEIPNLEDLMNLVAIHEAASHSTDNIIPAAALERYRLMRKLLGWEFDPQELRASNNELRYMLSDFEKQYGTIPDIDNYLDRDLIDLFEGVNGYTYDAIPRARDLGIPEEKLAEYIRYMLKYLPAATPFYFMDNQSEGLLLSPRYEPSDNTLINNLRLMYNKGGIINKLRDRNS